MDYSRFFNELSLARKPSPLRELTKLMTLSPVPITNFGNGMPNASTFPFESVYVNFKDGKKISIDGPLLSTALQYGPSEGYPKLTTLLKDFQKAIHKPQLQTDWSVAVTAGSQDGMSKTFEMLLEQGDYIIGEEYLYAGTIAIIRPYNVNHLKVKGDKDGMRPDSLRDVLKKWTPDDIKNNNRGVPKIIYIVPNGGNPVGTSTSAERRREIYKIAQEYNLLIIEDDPYYFVQFNENEKAPSFLSLDTDGRVLRFDSFSKILSGGLRVGYVTGPQPLLQRMVLHMQASQLHVSGMIQVIVHEFLVLLTLDGFLEHTKKIALFYKSQRDLTLQYAEKWLTGLAEWNVPECGMFLWVRVFGLTDTSNLITNRCIPKQVAFLPGRGCTIDDCDTPYLRISFSVPSEQEMDVGFEKLSKAIHEELEFNKI